MKPFLAHNPSISLRGITLLELLIVVTIILVFSLVAMNIYQGQVQRAQEAAAEAEIEALELAISRFEIDTGNIPLSGSGDDPGGPTEDIGSGLLHVALLHSASGNATNPTPSTWDGPYLGEISLGLANGEPVLSGTDLARIQILDPWDNPYLYVRSEDYGTTSAPAVRGVPLPSGHPFRENGEEFFNPSTFQIISFGPNGESLDFPAALDDDDITNFEASRFDF